LIAIFQELRDGLRDEDNWSQEFELQWVDEAKRLASV
jgi:hypothetical protein